VSGSTATESSRNQTTHSNGVIRMLQASKKKKQDEKTD